MQRRYTQTFLGNYKDPNYATIVEKMLQNFQKLGCKISLKIHVLHSYLENFSGNLGEKSEKQGERFHQDIKCVEKFYQGCRNVNVLALA